MEDLRYPIGTFSLPETTTAEQRAGWISDIARTPALLRKSVARLTKEQLATPYRPGGWTVHQVVHHVPDSHLNSFVRFKLALTETNPTIKPYDEALWARLADYGETEPETSLSLLETLHDRWVRVLRSMSDADFLRTFQHPELGPVRLDQNLGLYSWHGRHHVAHITRLRERMGW
jgi:hypothetical protein